jgi:hypothetical protein
VLHNQRDEIVAQYDVLTLVAKTDDTEATAASPAPLALA